MSDTYDELLARFTYKPGVVLSCIEWPEYATLAVATFGPNSRGGVDRAFSATRRIPLGLSSEQFRDQLVGLIRWWEEHEAYEWMRWDGALVHEPHNADGSAIGQQDAYAPEPADA